MEDLIRVKPNPNATNASPEKQVKTYCVVWLRKLAAAYDQSVLGARQTVYLEALSDFSEQQVEEAVTMAIGKCKFFPAVSELLECIHEATLARHKAQAQQQNQKLLDRDSKPDNWSFKLEDAYADIDKAALELWEKDMSFILTEDDHRWPKLNRSGEHDITGRFLCRCPKHGDKTPQMEWVCYDRIMEAKSGRKPRSAASLSAVLKDIRK